jgi:RNA polymerase sigma-70 factor (ECF subfamily)
MHPLSNLTEKQLLDRLRKGDDKAFERIYETYWERLYGYAYNRLQSKEAVEELLQEVFISLWEKRNHLEIHTSLSAYLSAAIRYSVYKYIASMQVRKQYAQVARQTLSVEDDSTRQMLSFEEFKNALEKQISSLPPTCRLVFTLSREENLSLKQIGEKLQISPKTAEVHIGRALKSLRIGLSEFLSILLLLYFSR